jgi:hypothetical protein
MAARKGSKPWNWRGEPVVDPRGYVLIFVGKDHPLADCRGYAYEHRLVAQGQTNRPLTSADLVHHDNEDKGKNDPDNLVLTDRHRHGAHHRKRADLRLPDEPNPEILCACGCGNSFLKFDATRRPRKFISGHNARRGANGRWEPIT